MEHLGTYVASLTGMGHPLARLQSRVSGKVLCQSDGSGSGHRTLVEHKFATIGQWFDEMPIHLLPSTD
jgi:hypothetical protein